MSAILISRSSGNDCINNSEIDTLIIGCDIDKLTISNCDKLDYIDFGGFTIREISISSCNISSVNRIPCDVISITDCLISDIGVVCKSLYVANCPRVTRITGTANKITLYNLPRITYLIFGRVSEMSISRCGLSILDHVDCDRLYISGCNKLELVAYTRCANAKSDRIIEFIEL